MKNRGHKLSLTRESDLLEISRGGLYDVLRPVSNADLKPMLRIDALHMEYLFVGLRTLKRLRSHEGLIAGGSMLQPA